MKTDNTCDWPIGDCQYKEATATAPVSQPADVPDQADDIFDLIREWAHLPEGQRGDVARNIIGRLNKSYMAGVKDTRKLMAASVAQPVQADLSDAARYRWLRNSEWYIGPEWHQDGPDAIGYEDHSGVELDTAIDAILAAAKKGA